jgi:histone H3/H4
MDMVLITNSIARIARSIISQSRFVENVYQAANADADSVTTATASTASATIARK